MHSNAIAPSPSACSKLQASDWLGLLQTAEAAAITIAGLILSRGSGAAWFCGQILLALALVQWFIVLHECGHETLVRSRRLNLFIGHAASFFSVIPFQCWKRVHASHHRWTGWQDLDPTTASLVPRRLSRFERSLVNISWRYWIPIFSVIYRINNYWNIARLRGLYGNRPDWSRMPVNTAFLLLAYGVTAYVIGVRQLAAMAGFAMFLAMFFEDPLILSQHTHIPQQASGGQKVRPFGAFEQEAFTRSLRFPQWFSRLVLMNFDAHELHHMYPFVPGYHLRRIPYEGVNEVHWWTWITTVKRIPGDQFLFQNRNDSGVAI